MCTITARTRTSEYQGGKTMQISNWRIFNEDQFKVAYVIIRKLKEWVELLKYTEREREQFKPLRMTVVGCAGTGKSVLINTVVGYIRKIFQDNNSVIVAAPTGAAAHNVGGQTLHREFKIGIGKNKKRNLSKKSKEHMMEKLKHTAAVFIDERSMLSQRVLGNN
jgi:predicted GTPase